MKKLLFLVVVFGFCSIGAVGQVGAGISSAPTTSPFTITGHMQRASQTPMATTQNLIGHFSTISAKGERPAWEFVSLPTEVPLGDVARAIRKEHEAAKKAAFVWVN
jgi:hypothetical protein